MIARHPNVPAFLASRLPAPVPDDRAYRVAARTIYEISDEVTGTCTEIPLDAEVTLDPDRMGGCWVSAIVWVPDGVAHEAAADLEVQM